MERILLVETDLSKEEKLFTFKLFLLELSTWQNNTQFLSFVFSVLRTEQDGAETFFFLLNLSPSLVFIQKHLLAIGITFKSTFDKVPQVTTRWH